MGKSGTVSQSDNLIKVIKIKIKPNKQQIETIDKTFGVCRFIWNKFISVNIDIYNKTGLFIWGYNFSLYVNHELSKEFPWIKEVSAKAIKDTIMNADKALKRFCKKKSRFIKFKSRKSPIQSYYFVKEQVRLIDKKHINLPILGKVKLNEYDYYNPNIMEVSSGRIVKENNEYFICLNIKEKRIIYNFNNCNKPLGIDVGIKNYAIIHNGERCLKVKHINKTNKRIMKMEENIKCLQRVISKKVEINKTKFKGKESYTSNNIRKLWKKIRMYNQTITRIRKDFIKKLCCALVKAKPEYITIEDLDVIDMLIKGYSRLADKVQKSLFAYFKEFLIWKCKEHGVELRIADKFFASSKTCSKCGNKKKSLKLTDRVYVCNECGLEIDRDENASLNLLYTHKYTIA